MVRRHFGTWIFWGVVALIGILAASTDMFAGTATTSDDFYVADELEVDGSVDVAGAIVAGGNISTSGDVLATNDVTAGGDIEAGGDITTTSVSATGDVLAGDDVTATDDLVALDDANVADSLYVGGNIVGGDSLYITTDAEVGDKLWVADLDVSDDAVFDDDVTISGEFGGAVCAIPFGLDITDQTGDRYLKCGAAYTGATYGVPMPKAGSIVAISSGLYVDSYTPVATAQLEVYVDGVEVWSVTETLAATGMQTETATQARGTDTFTAGQWLSFKMDVTGTIQYDRPSGVLLVQFD